MVGFPGRKERVLPGSHNLIVDYFYGSGGYSESALATNPGAIVMGAEANPRLAAFHLADSDRRIEAERIAYDAAMRLKAELNPQWNGKGTYGDLFPEDRVRLKEKWNEEVKAPFDSAAGLSIPEISNIQMASQLSLSSVGFGCDIRVSGNGLNIPPSAQKLRTFKKIIPFKKISQLESLVSSADLLEWEGKNAIALIDPPYVVPRWMRKTHKLLTACYPGHEPYGQATWDLYWRTIAKAMRSGAKTIAVANYYSPEMDAGVSALCSAFNYRIVQRNNFGAMTSQDMRHRFEHGKRSQAEGKLPHSDFEWILTRGKHRPIHDQGCIFFV